MYRVSTIPSTLRDTDLSISFSMTESFSLSVSQSKWKAGNEKVMQLGHKGPEKLENKCQSRAILRTCSRYPLKKGSLIL